MPVMMPPGLENGVHMYQDILAKAKTWYVPLLIGNGCVSALLFPLVLFLIQRKSPPGMSGCIRKLLLNVNGTSLGLALILAIWLPVPLHPELAGFSLGIVRALPPGWGWAIFAVWQFLLLNMFVNYMFVFVHYYALLKPGWTFHNRFSQVDFKFCTFYGFFMGLSLCFTAGFIYTAIESPDELLDYARSFQPAGHFVQVVVANEPSTMGLGISDDALCMVFIGLLIGAILFELAIIGTMNVAILLEIHRTRQHVQAATHCLQVTAYLRLFLAKTLLLLIFMCLPMTLITMSIFGFFEAFQTQMLAYFFLALHSPVLMLQTILFVKSYREWAYDAVFRLGTRITTMANRTRLSIMIGPSGRVRPAETDETMMQPPISTMKNA